MKGHQKIISMRMQGLRPDCVFVDDFTIASDSILKKFDWYEPYESICIEGDSIKTLDLTFLHDLDVRATLNTESRAKAFLDVCRAIQVRSVAIYVPDGKDTGQIFIEKDCALS
jgi:hypothetical protein